MKKIRVPLFCNMRKKLRVKLVTYTNELKEGGAMLIPLIKRSNEIEEDG